MFNLEKKKVIIVMFSLQKLL